MRRLFLGLVAVAALAACNDSTPTGTRPPGANLQIRAEVTPTGTLDEEIIKIINFWPKATAGTLLSPWTELKRKWLKGQTAPNELQDAYRKFFELAKRILHEKPKMTVPTPTGEDPDAAANRLITYIAMYVFGDGPDEPTPPPFDPEAETAVGLLEPGKPLTLVTGDGHGGVHFDKGSVGENRVVVITENHTFYGPCGGPLLTLLCQYPLYLDIASYPEGALLKVAQAEVCHPPVGAFGGPPDEATHARLRLAHPAPSDVDDYVPGGSVRITPVGVENIEILPLISQTFLPSCQDIVWEPDESELTGNFFERGLYRASRVVSRFASNIGKFLMPQSAWAIDQGGGGGFIDFGSPFNNVDPCSGPTPEPGCFPED